MKTLILKKAIAAFLFTALSLLRPLPASAATRYVDGNNALASDDNPGTEVQPWSTISKATPLLRAGDTLIIKAGIYRETVTLTQSGTAAAPITIQAYPGHEGQVVINAAEPVTNWNNCVGPEDCSGNPNWRHIQYADVANLVAAHPDKTFAVRQVFHKGRLLPRSRYPNAGWHYPTSIADPKKTFTDRALSQPDGYFAGALCHIKTAVWQLDAVPIAAFSRGKITLGASPTFEVTPRFGYFLTSVVGEINEPGEWAYEPARHRLYLWPVEDNSNDVEVTYRDDCLCTANGTSFNIVRGLILPNARRCGIRVCQSHDLVIEDSTVEHSFECGIRLQAESDSCDRNQILRNRVKHCCSVGINVDGTASHCTVEGNYVYATGVEHFGDDLLNGLGEGIFVWGPHARVRNNRVDRTGRAALYLGGQPIYREICFNHTSNSGLALSDGGSGIYTGGYHPGPEKDYIHHNIFAEAIGCNTMDNGYEAGLPVTIEKYGGGSPGLYVDEEGNNRIIEHNTIINTRYAGIFFHGAPGNVVRHNTCYGNKEMQVLLVGRAFWAGRTRDRMRLVNTILENNILFATDAQQRTLQLTMHYNGLHFGGSDQNFFYNPYATAHIRVERQDASRSRWIRTTQSLEQWCKLSGYDAHSIDWPGLRRVPQLTLAAPVKSRLIYNASLEVKAFELGPDLYCDVQGNGIRGTLVLQPFESKILIAAVDAVATPQAKNPVPSDGHQLGPARRLEWSAAATAASHNVYLGTDETAVLAADSTSQLFRGRQTESSFSLEGLLRPGARHFWRVDEVETDGTTIHQGAVWSFAVPRYLPIDDFETYADAKGQRLEESWCDGSLNQTGARVSRHNNVSTGGSDDTHGKWSMALAYDNTKPTHVCEIERRFDHEQDWTAGGAEALSLWFRGDGVSFAETSPGNFTMSAAGADTWGSRDEFRYAYKRLDGDGEIAVKIEDLAGMHYWTKAGVMIRESLDPGSAHAFMLVLPDGLRVFQNRPVNQSEQCLTAQGDAESNLPSWVKLERRGNQFTGYHSIDGVHWSRQSDKTYTGPNASPNPQTINMPAQVYLGLALSSHAPGLTTTATFSGLQTAGDVTGRWQVAEIGVAHPGNSPGRLYLTLQDTDGKAATVINPSPAATNIREWTAWKIPLRGFVGLDLRHIKALSLGVGAREDAAPAGTGRIYIDDLQLE